MGAPPAYEHTLECVFISLLLHFLPSVTRDQDMGHYSGVMGISCSHPSASHGVLVTQKNSGVTLPNGPSLGMPAGRLCALWSDGGQTGSALTLCLMSPCSVTASSECGALAAEGAEKGIGTDSLTSNTQNAYFLLEENRDVSYLVGAQ